MLFKRMPKVSVHLLEALSGPLQGEEERHAQMGVTAVS